jgi:hypothetical protein
MEHQVGFDRDVDEALAIDKSRPVHRLDDGVRGRS